MIIELQNFGPIKSFKFDTSKDMHAIFGKNNIGKSYAISAVYLILKGLKENFKNVTFISGSDIHIDTLFQKKSKELKREIEKDFETYLEKDLVSVLSNSFKNTFQFGFLQNANSNNNFELTIKFQTGEVLIKLDDDKQAFIVSNFRLNLDLVIQDSEYKRDASIENNSFNFYRFENKVVTTQFLPNSTNRLLRVKAGVISVLHSNIVDELNDILKNTYYLPASRSGLYNALNSFGPIFVEISRYRLATNAKFEIPNLSEPISDYYLNLNNIENTVVSEEYTTKFEQIEKDILKGNIAFDYHTKKYFYTPENTNFPIELSFTSSMISEIAPIIAHLKYIIPLESDKPSILFIEEPEAHLHPEIQILLLEYFVKLSKGNVKIVMTSHSNYIFNKLSNLLIANKIDKDKLSVSLMKMTPEGSVIEEGAMQMDEYGIEDNNFVDVAEELYEERMSLLEKL